MNSTMMSSTMAFSTTPMPEDDFVSKYGFLIGAGLSIIGSLASNLGVNVQKFSHMKEGERRPGEERPYTCQPLWLLGFFLVVLGSLGDFTALKYAAQSIVAPLAAVTLISNVIFAHYGLGEELTMGDLKGTALVLVGCFTSVYFGDHSEQEYTLGQLKSLFGEPLFILYAISMGGLCGVLYAVLKLHLDPLHAALLKEVAAREASRHATPSVPARGVPAIGAAPAPLLPPGDGGSNGGDESPTEKTPLTPANDRSEDSKRRKQREAGADLADSLHGPGTTSPLPSGVIRASVSGRPPETAEMSDSEFEAIDVRPQSSSVRETAEKLGDLVQLHHLNPQLNPQLVRNAPGRRLSTFLYPAPDRTAPAENRQSHLEDLRAKYARVERLHPFVYCALSGLFGGQSLLFAKSTVLVVSGFTSGEKTYADPVSYVFLIAMLFTIFSQLHFLALGLKYFDALYVVPVFQTWFIGISTLGGFFYFREFEAFKTIQFIMFPFGLLLTLGGVFILASARPPTFDLPEEDDEDSLSDDEARRRARGGLSLDLDVEPGMDMAQRLERVQRATRSPRARERPEPRFFFPFAPAAIATTSMKPPPLLGEVAEWQARFMNELGERIMQQTRRHRRNLSQSFSSAAVRRGSTRGSIGRGGAGSVHPHLVDAEAGQGEGRRPSGRGTLRHAESVRVGSNRKKSIESDAKGVEDWRKLGSGLRPVANRRLSASRPGLGTAPAAAAAAPADDLVVGSAPAELLPGEGLVSRGKRMFADAEAPASPRSQNRWKQEASRSYSTARRFDTTPSAAAADRAALARHRAGSSPASVHVEKRRRPQSGSVRLGSTAEPADADFDATPPASSRTLPLSSSSSLLLRPRDGDETPDFVTSSAAATPSAAVASAPDSDALLDAMGSGAQLLAPNRRLSTDPQDDVVSDGDDGDEGSRTSSDISLADAQADAEAAAEEEVAEATPVSAAADRSADADVDGGPADVSASGPLLIDEEPPRQEQQQEQPAEQPAEQAEQPAEQQPAEQQPAEQQPAEQQPAEQQPQPALQEPVEAELVIEPPVESETSTVALDVDVAAAAADDAPRSPAAASPVDVAAPPASESAGTDAAAENAAAAAPLHTQDAPESVADVHSASPLGSDASSPASETPEAAPASAAAAPGPVEEA